MYRKSNAHALLVGIRTGTATVKTVWNFLKKSETEIPYDQISPLQGSYLEKMNTLIWKDVGTSMFIAALFTIWKEHKCLLIDEWKKRLWYIFTMEFH